MPTKRTKSLERSLNGDAPRRQTIPTNHYLSTGCTPLNMAVSGRWDGGLAKGHYVWWVGDSESGKTFFAFTLLAECAANPNFVKYQLIYDPVEGGALMDVERFFGRGVAKRWRPPKGKQSNPQPSRTVEEFYFNLDDAMTRGPCLYVLDSMDALEAMDDRIKFDKGKAAHESGEKTAGSYGMAKAKTNSENIRRVIQRLRETGSILVVISQSSEKTVRGIPFPVKTAAGGKKLRFYAHVQIWTTVKEKIKKTVMGKPRTLGAVIQCETHKNRLTGYHGRVTVPFYRSYGLDDIGACVDYLLSEGHWKKVKGGIKAPELDFVGSREKLVDAIESGGKVTTVRKLVQKVWDAIESACELKRKKRYV